jgi:WXXGXW repeat (2 copies)
MRNTKVFLLSTAIAVLSAGVPLAGPANAQPMPPGMPAPFMPGDLHVRIVDTPRPAFRHEVRTERPSPNHVWVGGFWHHTGTDWNWNDGRWAEPPQRHSRWVAPRYQKRHDGMRYSPGHWSHEHLIYN